jgi:alpha-L-fucosidase
VPSFNAQDVRFTVKGDVLYAILLGWPGEQVSIEALKSLYPAEVQSVKMLGVDQELEWALDRGGMTIKTHGIKPCDHAYVLKIQRKHSFSL